MGLRRQKDFFISAKERDTFDILLIEPDVAERETVRGALRSLGYNSIYQAADHMQGLTVTQSRNFTHVIFSTKETNMPVAMFVEKMVEMTPDLVAIPTSFEPNADDVFELLQLGARGFVVRPTTTEGLESAMVMATKGDPLADAVLHAADRNEAFTALMAANLDKLADAMRQARKHPTAANEIQILRGNFEAAVKFGRTFAKDGEDVLREKIIDFFINLASGPASRLGRLRQRLRGKRVKVEDDVEPNSSVEERVT